MIRKKTWIMASLVLLIMLAGCTKQGINTEETESPAVRKDSLSSFSEEQSTLFEYQIGQFVLRCFQGLEDLKLPDNFEKLCVDNDEMDYVLQRQQYLINAISVMRGGQIRKLSLTDVELEDMETLSDERVRAKAYVKLSFCYADDAAQTPTGAGLEVMVKLLKTGDGQYLIEDYEELSAEYASMKKEYQKFCEEERKKGISDTRELIEQFFVQNLQKLKEVSN